MPYIPHLYTQSCDLWDGTSESQQRGLYGVYIPDHTKLQRENRHKLKTQHCPRTALPHSPQIPRVFFLGIRTQWIRSQPSGIQYLGTPDPASQADSVGPTVSNCHILNYPLVMEQFAMGNYII